MGYFEVHFYNICELKWRKEFPELILENWNRFLDDCQTPLDKNKEPEKLLETLNSVNKAIQFSIEFSDKEIPFLDNLIKRDKSGIRMNLNHKPTDTKRCLSYSKIHPKHCLKNVSFVMTRHICTIAKNNFLKNKYLRELKENFRIYGYPEKVVEIGIQKALKISQTELRQPKTTENNNNLTFRSTFHPNNSKIFDLIKSGVNTLVENNVNGFKNIGLVHAKRQPPNLKKVLTNFLFTNKTADVFKCSESRCLCCQQLLLEISKIFRNVGKQFLLKTKMTCGSRNVIYVVICPTCKEQYIGETAIFSTAST